MTICEETQFRAMIAGNRNTWVSGDLWCAFAAKALRQLDAERAEVRRLQGMLSEAFERIAKQSDQLGKVAEKPCSTS